MAKPIARLFEEYYTADLDITELFIGSGTKTRMVLVDKISLDGFAIEGRNFKYEDGRLNGGVIEKLTLRDADGTVAQTVSGMKIQAGQIEGDTSVEFMAALLTRVVYGGVKSIGTELADSISGGVGRDIFVGRAGDDILRGGGGKDVLIGGPGSDTFVFTNSMGRDTIKDFDADGGPGVQDFIDGTFASADISQSGKNTIVDFGNGDIFVLLKVDATQITVDDFV